MAQWCRKLVIEEAAAVGGRGGGKVEIADNIMMLWLRGGGCVWIGICVNK